MDRLVLQPMSGIEELRQWLYENCFRVLADRLVSSGQRTYQVLCVRQVAQQDSWPERFPKDCYLVGYRAFLDREALLLPYCRAQLNKRRRQLQQAAGTPGGERLIREAEQINQIIQEMEKWN